MTLHHRLLSLASLSTLFLLSTTASAQEDKPAPHVLPRRPYLAVSSGIRHFPQAEPLVPLAVEIGGRPDRRVEVGPFVEWAQSVQEQRVFTVRAGAMVRYRFVIDGPLQPWFGGGTSFEVISPGRHTAVPGPSAILGWVFTLQLGVDVATSSSSRLGIFGAADAALFHRTAGGELAPRWAAATTYTAGVRVVF
jgi:hypothetical protein